MRSMVRRLVVGPDGVPINWQDLPATDTRRWVWRKKAMLVAAVDGGLLSLESACERYRLTVDEFVSWKSDCSAHGYEALKIKSIQEHRQRRTARRKDKQGESSA